MAFLGNYHHILLIPIILLVPARVLCGVVEVIEWVCGNGWVAQKSCTALINR